MQIFWLSRHDLSPAQLRAIHDLHGEDVEIIKDPVAFQGADGLADYIRDHGYPPETMFFYAVAGAPHYIAAALYGYCFGVFENHPGKRQDGGFGLAAVYHVNRGGERRIERVWVNPDPASDVGEALIPVAR